MSTFPDFNDAADALEEARAEWLGAARSWAEAEHRRTGRPITTDDVRRAVPPPDDVDPRCVGTVFRAPHWERLAPIRTGRKAAHGRYIRQRALAEYPHAADAA